MGGCAEPDEAGLERLWTALRDGSGVQALSVRELARAWYGPAADGASEERMEAALEAGSAHFVALPHAPGLWRLPAPTEVRRAQASGGVRRSGPRPDSTKIQAVIDRHLGAAPDLYQRGVDPDSGAVTLRYFFPATAAARDAEAIGRIADEIRAPVTVWPQPHQGQLAQAALDALPAGLEAERAPAIYLEEGRVELRCTGEADPYAIRAAEAAFAARTGWALSIRAPGAAPAAGPAADEDELIAPPRGVRRSEVNFALSTARSWFGGDTGCYKASADQDAGVVTLRFHFPEVARARHAGQLAELAAFIGWAVRIWPQPHQEALMRAAREALPPGLRAQGAPAIQGASREVTLRAQGAASAEELDAAARGFAEHTGWALKVTVK